MFLPASSARAATPLGTESDMPRCCMWPSVRSAQAALVGSSGDVNVVKPVCKAQDQLRTTVVQSTGALDADCAMLQGRGPLLAQRMARSWTSLHVAPLQFVYMPLPREPFGRMRIGPVPVDWTLVTRGFVQVGLLPTAISSPLQHTASS